MPEPDLAADALLWERARATGSAQRDELARLAAEIGRAELRRRRAPEAEADDLAQEVVRSTLAYLERGGPAPQDLGAFLKYRAWGVLSDFRKRQRARPMPLTLEQAHDPADPAPTRSEGERRQTLAALADCRARLTAEQRATIELRYLEGLDGESIAARLGVHRNTVHVRVHRALSALRECLERKGLLAEDVEP